RARVDRHDADAHTDLKRPVAPRELELRDRLAQAFRDLDGAFHRAVGEQHGELVAAEPRDHVLAAHARLQDLRELPPQEIARRVAARVVDDLELIEIHVEQRVRQRAFLPYRTHRRREPLLELAAVDEAGQRVVARVVGELAVQLPLAAHVVENHHGADHAAAAILDRRGRILDRDRAPVAMLQHDVRREVHGPSFGETSEHRRLDDRTGLLVHELDDLLHALALRLAPIPAGELLRDRVQILDPAARIGREHGIADRLQRDLRALLLAEQRTLGRLALRDIRDRPFEIVRLAVAGPHDTRVHDDGDDAAVAPTQLILEVAYAAVRLERREQPFPIPRVDVEIEDPLRAERLVLADAEHAFQRRIRRDQIAVDRSLENAVDDVVEEAAIARLAFA